MVRLNGPTRFGPSYRCRRIARMSSCDFSVTFRCSAIRPRYEGMDLILFQGTVICEMAILRIGIPRRHLSRYDCRLHRFRPRTNALVIEKGHWSDLPGTVATLTVFLKDWKHVFVERYGVRRWDLSSHGCGTG